MPKIPVKDQPQPLKPHPTRRFLNVPFAEKDEAKALGAKWCAELRLWYVPRGKPRELFRWPDALLPPDARALRFTTEEAKRRRGPAPRRPLPAELKLSSGTFRLKQEGRSRLDHLLSEQD